MAKKKKSRPTYTSKGERRNCAYKTPLKGFDKELRLLRDWERGKNPSIRVYEDGELCTKKSNDVRGQPKRKY